jgi:hypothetical protein
LTWGARSSDPQKTSYRALVSQKFQEYYPKAHFNFVDASIGGTGAQLGAFRLDRDVLAYEPDLLFLDFTLNDNAYRITSDTLAAQEAIIRRTIEQADCPVMQLFLAAKAYVTDEHLEKMQRRTAHMELAQAYKVPCADAIVLMRQMYREGQLDLDQIWPPERFDTCHPCDQGYALYAQAVWSAFEQAVSDTVICRVPENMLHADTYMHAKRFKLSSLPSLPSGWRTAMPSQDYCAFDFLMTRWLDDVTIASNFLPVSRKETVPIPPAQPLFWGQSTPRSGTCRVILDGQEKQVNFGQLGANCTGRMWAMVAEGLDPSQLHTLQLIPVFKGPDQPQEICLESICIAGGDPLVRLDTENQSVK